MTQDLVDNWADDGLNFFGKRPSFKVDGVKFTIGTRFQITHAGYFGKKFEVVRVYFTSERWVVAVDLNEQENIVEGQTLYMFSEINFRFHMEREALEHRDLDWL
jgi:hypothetical protein